MELTDEQKEILRIAKNEDCDLIIDAGPGAAKTTVLALIAKTNPDLSFLYLAYNKKIVEEAKATFPSNVEVRTIHGLAYKGLKMWLARDKLDRDKLVKGYYNDKIMDIARRHDFDFESSGVNLYALTRYVRKAVTKFTESESPKLKPLSEAKRFALEIAVARSLRSIDTASLLKGDTVGIIYKAHALRYGYEPSMISYNLFASTVKKIQHKLVSVDKSLKVSQLKKLFTAYINSVVLSDENLREEISSDLKKLSLIIADFWRAQANVKDEMLMDHATYFKLFQMSEPTLDYSGGLLLDEWQDANPVMKALTHGQKTRKIIVGDQHQAIYRFTGAVNAIEDAKSDLEEKKVLTLTNSFRFGPDIAHEVNKALDIKRIIAPGSVHPAFVIKGVAPIREPSKEEMILCRTNMGVIEAAISSLAEGKKVFIGDSISEHFVDQLKDTYYLATRNYEMIKNEIIASYTSIEDYRDECKLSGDIEGTRAVHIVNNLGDTFEASIEDLMTLASGRNREDFDIEIMTAHKAKGLGRSRVRIWSDFLRTFYYEDGPKAIEDIPIDEINLWFVAVSRAKDVLNYPPPIRSWIDRNLGLKEKPHYKGDISLKPEISLERKENEDASDRTEKSL